MDFEKLCDFRLDKGGHKKAEDGLCAMEAVAWLEGLEHSYRPPCTAHCIADHVIFLNDNAPTEDQRQQLINYLPRVVGTSDKPSHRVMRRWMLGAYARTIEQERPGHHILVHRVGKNGDIVPPVSYSMRVVGNPEVDIELGFEGPIYGAMTLCMCKDEDRIQSHYWQPLLAVLDEMIELCGGGSGFSLPVGERVAAYRELVKA